MSLASQRLARNSVFDSDSEALAIINGSRRPTIGNDFLDYDDLQALELLRMAREGYVDVQPPEEGDVVFDDQFERRAREINRTPYVGSQKVNVIPERSGPWSRNGQLGTSQPLDTNALGIANVGRQQTILKLDEWGFPEVWSVMLGVTYSDDLWGAAAASNAFNITALVNIGAGGITQPVEVDWLQGTTFSAVMNAINIIAVYRASTNTPSDFQLHAQICRGKISGTPPTRSFQISSVGINATSAIVRIPAFTRSVMMNDRSLALGTVYTANTTLEFLQNPSPGTICGSVTGANLLNYATNGYPVPPFARYMQVTNSAAAAATVSPNLVCYLAL